MAGYCKNNEYPKDVTTIMQNQYEQQIVIRQCSEPTEQLKAIYNALQYKEQPFTRKKSVVPRRKSQNCNQLTMLFFLSG